MRSERRAGRRVSVEVFALERTHDGVYFQRATNLSLGGVYLDGTLPHPPGTVVTLELHVPDGLDPMRVTGTAVDARRDVGMGIRFGALPTRSRDRIARFLSRRLASANAA